VKRTIFLVLAIFVIATVSWSAPIKLTFMATGPLKFMPGQDASGYESLDKKLVADWMKANPGVTVDVIYRDVTQGMLSFQTLLAAGTPPDVWLEAAGNANPYLHDAYAIDFKQYLTKAQLAVYKPESISPYIRNGNYYALPEAQVAGGFAVNLDMLAAIGEKLPTLDKWTTDEFYRIAKKLKVNGIPSLVFFTKNGFSGWDQLWLSAFGGQMYKPGDYSKVTINSPQSVSALKWMKKLVDEGLVAAPPNEMTDDDSIELFTTGKLFSGIMQNGHSDYWVPEQVKAGKLAKEFAMTFVELPHAPGMKHAITFGYQTIVVAHRAVSDAKTKAIVKLAYEVAAGKDYVYAGCVTAGGFTTRTDVEPKGGVTDKPSYAGIAALAKVAGLQDLNPFGPKSKEVNSLWKEPIQAFFRGEVTAEKALADFEAAANEVLSR
jgi:ABC-type glycerol-3-phosphate transport system substrate-binding protein